MSRDCNEIMAAFVRDDWRGWNVEPAVALEIILANYEMMYQTLMYIVENEPYEASNAAAAGINNDMEYLRHHKIIKNKESAPGA